MKIKVTSLSAVKETYLSKKIGEDKGFRVKYIRVNTDPNSLESYGEKEDILRCLKGCIKDNGNTIDYNEISEIVDSSNIIGNNFWNEDDFERTCRFEYRNYFDFSECKFNYL